MRDPLSFVDRRRNVVRTLHYQGCQEVDIVEKLKDAGFFPETQAWQTQRKTVRRDLQAIMIADAKRFQAIEVDANSAFHAYISRQEAIYQRAMDRNDLEAAIRASKDIAKAHGVTTDEPNRPKDSIHDIMMRMKKNKQLPAPPIDAPIDAEITSFVPMNGKSD